MRALYVVLPILGILTIAYRYYSAFLAARVMVLDDARVPHGLIWLVGGVYLSGAIHDTICVVVILGSAAIRWTVSAPVAPAQLRAQSPPPSADTPRRPDASRPVS